MTKEIHRGGCLNCPQTEDILPMDTVLYNGFGGYTVTKNTELFYKAESDDYIRDQKTLRDIDDIAKDTDDTWRVILDSPLRGAEWTRQDNGEWLLTDTNRGFA